MKKTMVARNAAGTMHTAEDAVASALKASRDALAAMRQTKFALEMTGPEADAALARWQNSVELLEMAEQGMIEAHKDSYRALQDVKFRVVMGPPTFGEPQRDTRAA